VHILFLSDNFPPETNAPATRLFEHARAWVRVGHRVTVITCAPNFPEGRVHAGFENRWYARELLEGIEVVRVKTFISANEGLLLRTLDHLSFMVSSFCAGLIQDLPDVIVATSPQFFCAVSGWALAFARRKPFVFELRDLWPESIRAVGAMREGPVLRALERLELFLYRRAAAIVSVTESFKRRLVERGIEAEKIAVVRNGVDLSSYAPRARNAAFAGRLGVADKFVVGYLGTHGMAHALERVLEAAELLRRRDDIRFLFVGAGAARETLVEKARAMGLSNVIFWPSVPKQDMPGVWSLCDLALIHLKDEPLFSTVIPSKIFEAMGMGVPTLFAGPDGEAAGIVRSTRSGVVVPPERPSELARVVRDLCDDRERRRAMAKNAYACAQLFDRDDLAQEMLELLEGVAGVGATEPVRPREAGHELTRKAG
jgi:putative colanic acid biosynthesis glycosyltransferase WcaI